MITQYTANRIDSGEEVRGSLIINQVGSYIIIIVDNAFNDQVNVIDPSTLKPVISDKIKKLIEKAEELYQKWVDNGINDTMNFHSSNTNVMDMKDKYEQILKELGATVEK